MSARLGKALELAVSRVAFDANEVAPDRQDRAVEREAGDRSSSRAPGDLRARGACRRRAGGSRESARSDWCAHSGRDRGARGTRCRPPIRAPARAGRCAPCGSWTAPAGSRPPPASSSVPCGLRRRSSARRPRRARRRARGPRPPIAITSRYGDSFSTQGEISVCIDPTPGAGPFILCIRCPRRARYVRCPSPAPAWSRPVSCSPSMPSRPSPRFRSRCTARRNRAASRPSGTGRCRAWARRRRASCRDSRWCGSTGNSRFRADAARSSSPTSRRSSTRPPCSSFRSRIPRARRCSNRISSSTS